MVAFYAEGDLPYGGTIYTEVLYDGVEVARSYFKIRALPTLVEGFVADQDVLPLAGIEVEIPGLGVKATTDVEGSYSFGFGEPAEKMLPAGKHRLVVNPGMKNPSFGTIEGYIIIESERLSSGGMVLLPGIDRGVPFEPIGTGHGVVELLGGTVELDLSNAELYFPDGLGEGVVYAQWVPYRELGYGMGTSIVSQYSVNVQPAGVEVRGDVGIAFPLPPDENGDYAWIGGAPMFALIMGLDEGTLRVVPVGVGRTDPESRAIVSEGPVRLSRLDHIGFTYLSGRYQEIIWRHVNGELTFEAMMSELNATL